MDIDIQLLEKLQAGNQEFKQLFEEHSQLKTKIEELNKLKFLSPEQELERKTIQKQKLKTKDRLGQIVEEHQASLH